MLWLGANVMLEYDATEAQSLLTNNKENAIKSLEDVRMQLGSLMEYNYLSIEFMLQHICVIK